MAGRQKVAGHVQKGGKSIMVQRSFSRLGIPRMYRSSGTTDKNEFNRINGMLTALAEDGTPESVAILKKLNAGELSFLEVVAKHKKKGLGGVESFAESNPEISDETCIAWLKGAYEKESTRIGYFNNYRAVKKHMKAGERMNDLPTILKRYRIWCVENDKNKRAFNYGLAVSQAWVKYELGPKSETYNALRDVKRFKLKKSARDKDYFTPRQLMDVVARMPDEVGAMVWSMAMYGMGPKEYLVDGWEVDGPEVKIFGQKHEHRERTVPLIPTYPPAPVTVQSYRTLYSYLKKASKNTMTPYTMRNAYPRWLTEAGVPYNRVRMYQGHAEKDQTDTYSFHKTDPFLIEDGKRLQTYIEAELAKVPASDDVTKVVVRKPRGRAVSQHGPTNYMQGLESVSHLFKPTKTKKSA